MNSDLFSTLLVKCRGNSICIVERFKNLIDHGYEATHDDVKRINELLGTSSKKIEVFRDKYSTLFSKLINRFCYAIEGKRLCIYSWRSEVPARYFPVSLDSTGSVLLFNDELVDVLAYPIHRAHDFGRHDVETPDPSQIPVVEVSRRVDGYHITFYYNPILERWVPATRHALHNMRLVKGRAVTVELNDFLDPCAAVADEIALNEGLYEKLKGFEGWTFTAILEPPEPAIVKPNVEILDKSLFRLYILNARKPDGELLTIRESCKLLGYRCVDVESVEIPDNSSLNEMLNEWSRDLKIRSRFIRFKLDEPYRPFTLEVKSNLYPEAINVKYYSNPRSLVYLASSGYEKEAIELLTDYGDLRKIGVEIIEKYKEFVTILSMLIDKQEIDRLIKELKIEKSVEAELLRARARGSRNYFINKLFLSFISDDIRESRVKVEELLNKLREGMRGSINQ